MDKPRIMFDHDSRHTLIYLYEPPMHRRQLEAAVDELAGTPVDALMWTLGDGRTMLHDTKVGEQWGHNVEKWPHLIFQRAHRNLQKLIAEGNDPLRVICDRAHEKGMLLYPNLLLQQGYSEPGGDPRSSDFRFENRHLEIGAKGDLDEGYPGRTYLDFKHQEVRDERFAIIDEVLRNYPVDGFELNFNLLTPTFFHPSEAEQGREIMTEWVRQVYRAVKASGPDRELAVCVPASVDLALQGGLDPLEWIQQGTVDVVIGQSRSLSGPIDPTADFRPLIEAARGSECRVHGAIHSGLDSDRLGSPSIEMVRATACNYYEQGVDGLYLAHWFAYWPYENDFYGMLRELPHPDIMAPKDKIYVVPTETGRPQIPESYGEDTRPLPADLEVGETLRVELEVSDDLALWDGEDRVHEVMLRVRVVGYAELDRLSFVLNGEQLTSSELREINRMYMMSAPRYRAPGQWFIFRLSRDHWPAKGGNSLEITMLERDPDVLTAIYVRDVELEIKYLMGKSFHRGFVDPDLGPYEHAG